MKRLEIMLKLTFLRSVDVSELDELQKQWLKDRIYHLSLKLYCLTRDKTKPFDHQDFLKNCPCIADVN